MVNPHFVTGFWIMLGVLAAVVIVTLLMSVFKRVA